jgi:glycosyltransferase involved in cell wall biosynthesis
MKIAIHALSASAGGGRTYLLNLARALPGLAAHHYRLYVPASAAAELADLPANFQVRSCPWAERSYAARFFWEQCLLPREVKAWGADVLVCVGNFCPLRSAVPVVLLSRNPLYFTPHFLEDLLARRHYRWAAVHLLMRRLAWQSARAARLTIAPTAAFAEMMRSDTGDPLPRLRAIHHGFQLWPGENGRPRRAAAEPPPFRFLVVSHYNYFRNFETVLRAFALLRAGGSPVHLVLSTKLEPGLLQGGYDTTRASRLIDELGIRDTLTMLGRVAYDDLPDTYRSAHAVICPAYTESFSHTVVEAMSLGRPVIASDIGVHREVAGEAALFFSPLDPEDLAAQCRRVMNDAELRARLSAAGLARAQDFSWRRHFEQMLGAAAEVAAA